MASALKYSNMTKHRYTKPELQAEHLELGYMLAESGDLTGGDMPIDDTDLTF